MGQGKTLSVDLRERIVAAVQQEGLTYRQAAARFSVGEASVSRFLGLLKRQGSLEPMAKPTHRPTKLDDDDRQMLRAAIDAVPDATIMELRSALFDSTGKRVSPATVGREVRKLRYSRKKSPSSRPNKARSGSSASEPPTSSG